MTSKRKNKKIMINIKQYLICDYKLAITKTCVEHERLKDKH